jgi:hypothetical protein
LLAVDWQHEQRRWIGTDKRFEVFGFCVIVLDVRNG